MTAHGSRPNTEIEATLPAGQSGVGAIGGSTPTGRSSRRIDRRGLLIGAGVAGLATASVVTGRRAGGAGGEGRVAAPTPDRAAVARSPVSSPATSPAASPPPRRGSRVASPAAGRGGFRAEGMPEGMALVTSPRLPLFGVGPEDAGRLLWGEVDDWRAVGSAVALPVEPLALAGQRNRDGRPVAIFDGYEALVSGLVERPGGVALVPLAEVDLRVNVLSVGGNDPLRDADDEREPTLRIGVVGDIVPGRNVHNRMVEFGDFARPFREIAPHLAAYDLTFANLEGNLSDTLPQPDNPNSTSFVSSPAMIEGFRLAGIDAVSLANNHSRFNSEEWGAQGLLDTMDALDAADLPFFGAGRDLGEARAPLITRIKGRTIALLGVDGVTANREVAPGVENGVVDFDAAAADDAPGTNPFLAAQVLADIADAAGRADIVIPYFHMGREYVAVPPEWVSEAARAAIDAGATAVVTLHPHVIQGMEIYAGKPIVYSPGNFVFDQMFSVEVRSGYVLDLTLRGDRVVGLRCHGVEIEDFHQPRPMTAGEQANLMDRFWAATDRISARTP